MPDLYQIVRTQQTMFQDKGGQVVRGYDVTVFFPEWNETHTIQVQVLQSTNVDKAIRELWENRKSLADLGRVADTNTKV